MKKYELTSETKVFFGKTMYRIKALVAFGDVEAGELGGFIEKEDNLDQSGDARVSGIGAIFWIDGIGSRNGTTTFFACKDKEIRVVCGCFFGTLEEFVKKVQQNHGDNQYAKVYLLAAEMAKARIDTSKVREVDKE